MKLLKALPAVIVMVGLIGFVYLIHYLRNNDRIEKERNFEEIFRVEYPRTVIEKEAARAVVENRLKEVAGDVRRANINLAKLYVAIQSEPGSPEELAKQHEASGKWEDAIQQRDQTVDVRITACNAAFTSGFQEEKDKMCRDAWDQQLFRQYY